MPKVGGRWASGLPHQEGSWILNPILCPAQVAMPKVGGWWASGLPRLDLAVKRADAGSAGLWLELRQLHVEALKACGVCSAALCIPCCHTLHWAMLIEEHSTQHIHLCVMSAACS